MQEPLIACIVLNNNRRDDTLACLQSLNENTYENFFVILLDNQSDDGTVEEVSKKYPDTHIISLFENLGYAGNNNIGIHAALKLGADWLLLLNEDTVLDAEAITRLVEAGACNASTGIVGPMVYHYSQPQHIQSGGGMLGPNWESIHQKKNELDLGLLQATHPVQWISGCAIMVRREVIDQIGMLDEDFFCYWEETDWCLRAGKAGWQVIHVPKAKLWHKGVKPDYMPSPMVTYYSTRNRLLLVYKHHAPARVWINTIVEIIRTLISWSIRPKWRSKRALRNAMWRGMLDFLHGRWGKQEI